MTRPANAIERHAETVFGLVGDGIIPKWQEPAMGALPWMAGAAPDFRRCPWCDKPRSSTLAAWERHRIPGVCLKEDGQ